MQRAAFTLIELLISIAIVAVLMAILLPAVARVRRSAQRTACRATLRDIGERLQMYLQDSRLRLPVVNSMPSVRPPLNGGPSLVALLAPYSQGDRRGYACPADRITHVSPGAPTGYDTYFDREGSSYQYNPFLSAFFGGQTLSSPGLGRHPEEMVVLTDYEPFHGTPRGNASMNALFLDYHVADLSDFMEP